MTTSFRRVVVTVPTYNESECIAALVADILSRGPHYEVLVADDDSPDGTWRIVADLARDEPRVHLLHRTTDRGRGRAGRDAFVRALELGADAVVEMDADFSHHPRHIPELLAALEDADLVLGSRQVPGGLDLGRPWWRVWLTKASNLFVRVMLGVRVGDCNSGFRAFRRATLERVDVARTFSPGPAIVHELLYKTHLAGLRIREVPIAFRERELGASTLTFRKLLRSYVTVFQLRRMGRRGDLLPAPERVAVIPVRRGEPCVGDARADGDGEGDGEQAEPERAADVARG